MSGQLKMEQFVEMTRNVARGEEEFLPTFVDAVARDVRVLEGVPASEEMAQVARRWAAEFGAKNYFIAYPGEQVIIAEEYRDGFLAAARDVHLN